MAYDSTKPANDGFLADAPQELRTNFEGLKSDQIVDAGTLKGLSPGNASGNIPISNGTLNINLNAEKLNGQPASYYATATHTHSTATSSSNGFMSNTDKAKLDTIATGAEVNQNAFSNILVGGTTIQADSKTDTVELVAGTNISLSPDATNDRVTINCTYTHPSGDGNLHVPATGTSNNGKVLKAGASAGSIAWGTLSASDITNTPAGNISATTVQAAINELDSEKVSVSEVVTTATANKILKLNSNAKLPASITGDAATVGGHAASEFAKLSVINTFTAGQYFSTGTYTDPLYGVVCAIKAAGKIAASDAIYSNGKQVATIDMIPSFRTFNGTSSITGLTPGKKYLVSVYGITASRGETTATLNPVKVTDSSGTVLAQTQSVSINWHDGNTPQSATMVITAPNDGIINGYTDNGAALNMWAVELG